MLRPQVKVFISDNAYFIVMKIPFYSYVYVHTRVCIHIYIHIMNYYYAAGNVMFTVSIKLLLKIMRSILNNIALKI